MPAFVGANMYVQWVGASGTVTLQGDERTVNWNPSGDFVEASAGTDTRKQRLHTLKDFSASVAGRLVAGGTVQEDVLSEGLQGTLTFGPEGTAVGKRKYIASAFSSGYKTTYKYADISEFSVDFTGDGITYTKTTW